MGSAYVQGGVTPVRAWQYVASSLFGGEAFNGGVVTALAGLFIHFGVGFGVAAGFYLIARMFPAVSGYAVVAGTLYGIVIYFAMTYAIVPLTAVKQGTFNWVGLIRGVMIHILFVGLPPALVARWSASPS